jgi:transglycosylase-like protein with SLT domain
VALLSSPRNRIIAAVVVTATVVLVGVAAFAGLRGGDTHPVADPPGQPSDSGSAVTEPSPSPLPVESPTPSPTPSKKPTATTKKAPPPKPKPVTVAKPPPPPPAAPPPGPSAPSPGASCPKLTGPVAPRSAVAAAMSTAAGRTYQPDFGTGGNPAISVRLSLVEAIGWEESGWQNTILACDGGMGTMQVMPATVTWINQNYGWGYDPHALDGNIYLGTGLLAWLTRYFGDRYFSGNYSLAGDPDKIVLLDMVISAYQAGFGTVDNALAAGQDLPNRWYVDTVEGFMTHQPWSAPAASPT